jgi:nucleoid-associated protein YgaU
LRPEQPLELTLLQADCKLDPSPPGDVSPAIGLVATDPPTLKPGPSIHEASYFVPSRPALEELAPPPELPVSFRPAAAGPSANADRAWKPPRRSFANRDHQPRDYRLRDGDTLENLAERFLGSRGRAAEIYAANQSTLDSPELLPIGKTIIIPPKAVASDLEP